MELSYLIPPRPTLFLLNFLYEMKVTRKEKRAILTTEQISSAQYMFSTKELHGRTQFVSTYVHLFLCDYRPEGLVSIQSPCTGVLHKDDLKANGI